MSPPTALEGHHEHHEHQAQHVRPAEHEHDQPAARQAQPSGALPPERYCAHPKHLRELHEHFPSRGTDAVGNNLRTNIRAQAGHRLHADRHALRDREQTVEPPRHDRAFSTVASSAAFFFLLGDAAENLTGHPDDRFRRLYACVVLDSLFK
jgi:hypothetical protein